jgi:alkanesulfonate monooxygenase SsuD/methylene tetrahydromethanopterin reductase-like flavin-dependent oxidoreductase (luciferase family)
MEFGYFTLSDNRYPDNMRTPEQFITQIYDQALWAERLGMHSAWVGEHHFNLLGINACPNILLAKIAGATTRIRLAPAVVLLPVHHPLHVAEEWATLDLLSGGRVDFAAGRGYDRAEYAPFGAPFERSSELFAEGMEILWRAWTEPGRWSHKGEFYQFDDIEIRPRPAQQPLRPYVACFSRPSMELAAKNDWNIIYAPFAAAMVYGSLGDAVRIFREEADKFGRPARRGAPCARISSISPTRRRRRNTAARA